jgi:hypothetical protein
MPISITITVEDDGIEKEEALEVVREALSDYMINRVLADGGVAGYVATRYAFLSEEEQAAITARERTRMQLANKLWKGAK